jgi:hypothetical protein
MNCRDDGDGARWNMLNNEGEYHKVVSQNEKEFVYKIPCNSWRWHSLPIYIYIEFFIKKILSHFVKAPSDTLLRYPYANLS